MKTTWMLCSWLVVMTTTTLAEERSPSPVDSTKSYRLPSAADARTEPPPGEAWPVKPLSPPPAAQPPQLERSDSPSRVQTPRTSDGVPRSIDSPYGVPQPSPYAPASVAPSSKADHLRKAVEHLESAGLKDEAARLRPLLEAEIKRQKETLLRQKEAQLNALQQEVERLRAAVGSAKQVMLRVQVIEAPYGKLKEHAGVSESINAVLGEVNPLVASSAGHRQQFAILDADSTSLAALETLLAQSGVKVLADPTLVTVSGRPASFRQGGEMLLETSPDNNQSNLQPRPFGTEVDFVPQVLGAGRIRLEVRIRVSEPAEGRQFGNAPRLHVREVDTGVELDQGQVLVLGGLISTHKRDHDVVEPAPLADASPGSVTLFVVRPSLVDAMYVEGAPHNR